MIFNLEEVHEDKAIRTHAAGVTERTDLVCREDGREEGKTSVKEILPHRINKSRTDMQCLLRPMRCIMRISKVSCIHYLYEMG